MKTEANQAWTKQKNDFVQLGKLAGGFAKDSNSNCGREYSCFPNSKHFEKCRN